MPTRIDDAARGRIAEALRRGATVAEAAQPEGVSVRSAGGIAQEIGVTRAEREEARYGRDREKKAKAWGLVMAGAVRRTVEAESGMSFHEITANRKPRWWGPRYEAIAERWRQWAVETLPPEYLMPGRTGRRPLESRGRLTDSMENAEALRMVRQIMGGMQVKEAARLHGISDQTARRVVRMARERGLA